VELFWASHTAAVDEKPLGVIAAVVRLLTFRLSHDEFVRLDRRHLALGLGATWLAGIGRYWDHPDAHVLQYAGLGSVIYVAVLSLFLWLLIWPLRPASWGYVRVLTFVTLTAPPALLYAIPVERFMPLEEAQTANLWFLLVVASWRVALLLFFLCRVAKLHPLLAVVASLLPLALIIVGLAIANLEQAVFTIMAGKPSDPPRYSPADSAYAIVVLLALLSWVSSPFLLIAYLIAIYQRYADAKHAKGPRDAPTQAGETQP
jgi:hypothetical protein